MTETPRTGWFVATEGTTTVALDLEITSELRAAGIARDVVRLVQQARKDIGLHITDRINLRWQAQPDTAHAIREHQEAISEEVLAVSFIEADDGILAHEDADLGVRFTIEKAPATAAQNS